MKCLSMFANVGIGETYFSELGIEVVVANEFLEDRADFYKKMHPKTNMIRGDITDPIIYEEVIHSSSHAGVDFIMATPPCQGMSIAHAKRAKKNDPRNSLIKQVVRATKDLKPKYVLVENVRGMASDKTVILDNNDTPVKLMDYLESSLCELYDISYKVLDASDFETPHNRERLITLLSRKDCPVWEHPVSSTPKISVQDVIGGLPSLEAGQDSSIKWHSMKHKNLAARHVHWMRHTPTGQTAFDNEIWCPCTTEKVKVEGYDEEVEISRKIKGFKTTYKRMDWDKPAPTVTMANGSINSQNNVHPGRRNEDGTFSDARVLTIKELCAIVGLPLDWVDHLDHTQQRENFLRKVLGECFPPIMAKYIVGNMPTIKGE